MHDLQQLRAGLSTLLGARAGGAVEVGELTPLTGGYSLFTARFQAITPEGTVDYVVRADPPSDAFSTRTDRAREWALLDALTLGAQVPMPAARYADTDGSVLGTPAIVLDFVDGPQLLGHLQTADEAEQRRLSLAVAEAIGAVHRVGAQAAPASFERPVSWDAYIDEGIEAWRQVERDHVERMPFLRWIATWLDAHRPPPGPLTLVHGEFQTGNVMVGPDGALQIIDWEYAHVGDPRADLGWCQNVAAFTPPDPIGLDPVAFCDRYCEVTGLSPEIVNPLTVGWFSILGGSKALGQMLQGIGAMAAGQNSLIASAFMVSVMPFTVQMWRHGTAAMEGAIDALTAGLEAQMEATR